MAEIAQNQEGDKPFLESVREYNATVGDLLFGDAEYKGEQTRDALSSKLLSVQTTGRLNQHVLSMPELNDELAILAGRAKEAANKHNDPKTATFFSQVEDSFRVKETKASSTPDQPSKPRPKRVVIEEFGGKVSIR